MEFSADIVWGCSVATQRINGGYFKEDVWNYNSAASFISKRANKTDVKGMLATQDFHDVTDEDIANGKAIRQYFCGYLLKEVSGTITNFGRQALRIAQMDTFTNRQLYEISIISCLPNQYHNEVSRKNIANVIRESTPLVGNKEDYIIGDLIIITCNFNNNYNKYRVQGRFGESFVDFWFNYGDGITAGDVIKIKGRIKQHRADGSTQLNYVKLI